MISQEARQSWCSRMREGFAKENCVWWLARRVKLGYPIATNFGKKLRKIG